MKPAWFFAASLFSQLAFSEAPLDADQVELLIAQERFAQAITVLTAQSDYPQNAKWQELHATALYAQGQNEQAAKLLEKSLQQFPQTADLYQVAALNNFSLAQQASIFSAAGLAKSGLAQLKEAVRLAPDNAEFKLNLIGFYLQAPGIAGGDEDAGKQLAKEVASQDEVMGAIASAMVFNNDDKPEQALAAIDAKLKSVPDNSRLLGQKAQLLTQQKQAAAAFGIYQQAVAHATKPAEKQQYLYQIGRLAAAEQQDSAAGKAALNQVIDFYQGGDGNRQYWARLRLAQILLAEQQIDAAEQQFALLANLNKVPESLEKEIKNFKKQLKKQQKKSA